MMYKINYSAGQGDTKILRLCQKQDNHWIEINDSELVEKIQDKHFNLTHFYEKSEKVGYGEFVLNSDLTFITGDFVFPDKI